MPPRDVKCTTVLTQCAKVYDLVPAPNPCANGGDTAYETLFHELYMTKAHSWSRSNINGRGCLAKMKRSSKTLILWLCIFLILLCERPARAQISENFECSDDGCCDHHEFCQFWQRFGECENNRGWMMTNCQITCGRCRRTPRPTPQQQRPQSIQFDQLKLRQPPSVQLHQDSEVIDEVPESQTVFQPDQPQPPMPQDRGQQQPSLRQQQTSQAFGPRQGFQGNNAAKCEQIRQNNLNNATALMIKEGLLAEREDASFRKIISLEDILQSNRQFACAPQQLSTDCSRNTCYNLRYRTMDGTCNNFRNPLLGAAATPFMRLRPANYDDGIGAPTGTIRGGRPSARETTRFILRSPAAVSNNRFNTLLMQFGQFVTHDITKTSTLPHDQCPPCQDMGGHCLPIRVEPSDGHSACPMQNQQFGQCCLNFARASPICGTGQNSVRLQLNENTAFLDGSMIYGSSIADNFRLREGPFMRVAQFNGRRFLPFDQEQCGDPFSCKADFKAGDDRVTIFVGLAAFHTIMLREHNRIASILQTQNRHWNDDRVFQEARKIVGAELQAITYKEWLPKILGSAFSNIIGQYKGYDPDVNPSIASEFTHGAMRFGHGMIPEFFTRLEENGQSIPQGGMRFDDGILKPQRLLFEGGIDPLIRGMMTMPVKKPQRIANIVTERMFGNNDLASINLQRGRDAGVPSYNEMRDFCGLKKARTFDEVSAEILDANVRGNLQKGFSVPDNVDLYVGALMEDPISDAMVGATLSCIIGDQFKRVRNGDRFWYQNPAAFTADQLAEIEKVTLARIICDNSDNIRMVPADAFQPSTSGNLVSCSNIPSIDLRHWNE